MTASTGTGATDDEIAAVAYEIWESEGRPEGQAQRHWHLAQERLARDDSTAGQPDDATEPADEDGAEPVKDHTYVRPAGRKKMDLAPSTWSKTDEELDESFPASDPPGNY